MGCDATPSVGIAPLNNLNYNGDGIATLGVVDDGVNGRIGNAGSAVIGTQIASGGQTTSSISHNDASTLRIGDASIVLGGVALLAGMVIMIVSSDILVD
jgi:hypothetical protein